jgi:hypothetical protein
MNKDIFAFITLLLIVLAASAANASSLKIVGPYAIIQDNDIIVNTGVVNVKELEKSLQSGIEKEVVFTVELIRVWNLWPDEFVSGKKIKKVIRYDNLRDRYWASSPNSASGEERKFRDFESMQSWLSSISPITIGNIKSLEEGRYYVRVVVESKSTEYPLMIGLFMHLIPETEMSLAKESEAFTVGAAR